MGPSAQPTPSPTQSPTNYPTKNPTLETLAPTEDPTADPTSDPTQIPTKDPTTVPTTVPTGHPSVSPSTAPSAAPSVSPTNLPTKRPSKFPTLGPDAEIGSQTTETMTTVDSNANPKQESVNPMNDDSDRHYTLILIGLIAAIVCCCGFIVATLWWNKRGDKKKDVEDDGVGEEGILTTTVPQPGVTPMQHSVEMYRINSTSQMSTSDIPNTMQMSPIHYQNQMLQMQQMHVQMMNMPMTAALNANMNGIVTAINQSIEPAQTPVADYEVENGFTKGGDDVVERDDTSDDEQDYDPMYNKENDVEKNKTDGL